MNLFLIVFIIIFFNMLTYLGTNTPYIVCKKNLGGYSTGVHLFPFRTEKLRPVAQMVLPIWWESMSLPVLFKPSIYTGFFFDMIINLGDLSMSNSESL